MFVETAKLPRLVSLALTRAGFRRRDIAIRTSATAHLSSCGGTGIRGFAFVVNTKTGAIAEHWGSWGGPNPFASAGVVDDMNAAPYALQPYEVIVTGHSGHRPYATITVHPDNAFAWVRDAAARARAGACEHTDCAAIVGDDGVMMMSLCPDAKIGAPLTKAQRGALEAIGMYKGGAYRHEEIRRAGATAADLDVLVARGLVKRNRAGAIAIMTAGRNAREAMRGAA